MITIDFFSKIDCFLTLLDSCSIDMQNDIIVLLLY